MYEILEEKRANGTSVFIPRAFAYDYIEQKYLFHEITYLDKCLQQNTTYLTGLAEILGREDPRYINLHDGFNTYDEALKFINNIKEKELANIITETIIHKI
jgi:hypothetical protein